MARSSLPGFEVPELVRLMEHRGEEVEQCNMLLLLLLVNKWVESQWVEGVREEGGKECLHSVTKGEEVATRDVLLVSSPLVTEG